MVLVILGVFFVVIGVCLMVDGVNFMDVLVECLFAGMLSVIETEAIILLVFCIFLGDMGVILRVFVDSTDILGLEEDPTDPMAMVVCP